MTGATRAPAGSTAARQYDRAIYRAVPLWPGIAWGHDARCSCSWACRHGVMQVKVTDSACTVHAPGRRPEGPANADAEPLAVVPEPSPPADPLLSACRSGTVTQELYEAAVESWQADRGALPPEAALRRVIAVLADALGGDR